MLNASAGRVDQSDNRDSQWGVRPRLPDILETAKAHLAAVMAEMEPGVAPATETAEPADAAIPANFLDALPQGDEAPGSDDYISAVNSDDAGIYRMFINLSP
ncbi:hypothetical protein [Rhizobium halophytocola]|uniref:Uncharacterized protein n=1 Tax=Rhizobium halophytocola TaxID=735519 RepID=A0ABS4E138_9HYPH|nr:hypothetical protein [Rhizobium halophytocola]MBP1851652.1 hypothetical protein [Rhizobium halophytocola]